MICVYDIGNEAYTRNGDAVLTPTRCTHRQVAAGKYDLTIVHPVDPEGKWAHIVPEAVIRAPVPEEKIETAVSGLEADVYRTNTANVPMRSGPSEPTAIVYNEWNYTTPYSVGAKVTCSGWSHRNYQCKNYDGTSPQIMVPPYNNSEWWTPISDYTSGSPVIVTLKSGTDLYYISSTGTGWYLVSTIYGMEGYVKTSQVTFYKHLTPSETQPRNIKTQLFRIKTVDISTDGKTVTATAEHVSYDMSGVIIKDAKIAQMNPAGTLAWIEDACMMDYRGTIATNMTGSEDGTYTGEIKGKNLTYALLDPDKGVVKNFGAMYRRDNWDVFVMRRTNTNRGFQLRYRKNLVGVNWTQRTDALVTRVVPVAKDEDGSDLYLSGTEWVDSSRINNYPVVRMERITVPGQVGKDDGTGSGTNWTAATLRAEMAAKAAERFSVDKADQIIHEITVDFEMLGDTEEYKAIRKLEKMLMYDQVAVRDSEIGLNVTAEVVEIEFDCIREKITAAKLSNVNAYAGKNISGYNIRNNSITADKLTDDVLAALQ